MPLRRLAALTVPGTVKTLEAPGNAKGFLTMPGTVKNHAVKLEQALTALRFVVDEAPGPVSVFVADSHGEVVAAATMDGAAPDTRLNAQRKAYTAARSDARATSELAAKVADDPVERASFDPFFTFFKGGVAAFDGETRVGAVGVSGLPGEVDEQLARRAIEAAGLSTR
jgi:glc operon protein GlcG